MATRGRLESRVTVPTGGYTGTINDSGAGAATAWTLAAGEYFLSSAATTGSSLVAAFSAALNLAATTDTITVTLSAGEAGTGKVTIASTGTAAIVFTSTALRDLLGFSGDPAAGTTWTSEGQARSLWLPDCAYNAMSGGAWRGHRESDFIAQEHPSGFVFGHMGRELQANALTWNAISRARTWAAHETTANASWERFARDCIWATTSPWGTPGGPVRFYPDAASDAAFCTYTVPDVKEINPAQMRDGWAAGPWVISLPRMIVDPTYAAYGA